MKDPWGCCDVASKTSTNHDFNSGMKFEDSFLTSSCTIRESKFVYIFILTIHIIFHFIHSSLILCRPNSFKHKHGNLSAIS